MSMMRSVPRLVPLLARLTGDRSGLAMVELAYTMPLFLILLAGGVELTNYATTHMRISQVAVSLADNASRAKQEVVSGVPRMREVDVNESFAAAQMQAGGLDLKTNGRVILSSLEQAPSGGQWIHWQRCFGEADYSSSYGEEGAGSAGSTMSGMGPAGRQVAAEEGTAIMFVEVVYDYDPVMFGDYFKRGAIRKTAAMYIRDDRDLSDIYNPSPSAQVHDCD